jgi:hypothetical protein
MDHPLKIESKKSQAYFSKLICNRNRKQFYWAKITRQSCLLLPPPLERCFPTSLPGGRKDIMEREREGKGGNIFGRKQSNKEVRKRQREEKKKSFLKILEIFVEFVVIDERKGGGVINPNTASQLRLKYPTF